MKLSKLLSCLISNANLPDLEIDEITENSLACHPNAVFVCVEGFRVDGHRYALNAYEKGCRAFIAQKKLSLPADAFVLQVNNTRTALGELACQFYGHPSKQLSVIGITGTKGKTSVSCMLRKILEQNGISCGYIGTNGIVFGDQVIDTKNTTPDAVTLQKALRQMADAGCRAAILEVSSQALLLDRVRGMHFEGGVFTNLFSDHIGEGEHKNFEDYKRCKQKLFTDFPMETIVCYCDDPHAQDMLSSSTAPQKITCSLNRAGDYRARDLIPTRGENHLGIAFEIHKNKSVVPCYIPLIGSGNAISGLLAIAVAKECFKITLQDAANALKDVEIEGRSQIVPLGGGKLAVIDYAHNGESLRQLLLHLREFHPNRLIALFGSVGERTEIRRQELGEAAGKYSDLCILTSDNPGRENPQRILDEIAQTVSKYDTPYVSIIDRREAIHYAIDIMEFGDILVLAGKGHEKYQLIGTEKIPFSEREILLNYEKSTV